MSSLSNCLKLNAVNDQLTNQGEIKCDSTMNNRNDQLSQNNKEAVEITNQIFGETITRVKEESKEKEKAIQEAESTGLTRLTVGVLGVGHLMAHVVPGFMRSDSPPKVLLSARNAARVSALVEEFGLETCAENRDLVERSDVVVVAVRPDDVERTISDLPWRVDQTVLSFAATISHDTYTPHVNRADIVLAMPVITAEFGASPTSIWPANVKVQKLLASCGPVIVLETEEQFMAASGTGAFFGLIQELIKEMTESLSAKGVPEGQARELVAGMTQAGAVSVIKRSKISLEELINDLCLPGSLTAQGLKILREHDAFSPWKSAADSIHARHIDNN